MDPTQGNAAPEAVQAGEPKPQETVAKTMTAEEFNRAWTAKERTAEKKQAEALAKFQEALLGNVTGKLEELLSSKFQQDSATPPAQTTPETRLPSIEESPQFKALQGQLAKMQSELRREADLRAQTEAKARDTLLRSRVAEAAATFGVDAKRAKVLVGHLIDSEKKIKWGEDGSSVLMSHEDGDVDVRAGLESFFKSDEGKFFMPPTGAVGSGDRPAQGGVPVGRNTTREQLAAMLVGHLAGR